MSKKIIFLFLIIILSLTILSKFDIHLPVQTITKTEQVQLKEAKVDQERIDYLNNYNDSETKSLELSKEDTNVVVNGLNLALTCFSGMPDESKQYFKSVKKKFEVFRDKEFYF